MTTNITLPRATVEQALEALENCTSEHGHRCSRCDSEVDEGGKVVAALRAALAQQAEPTPDTCTWWQDGDSDSDTYQTSCGKYFAITDGTPEDNKMRHCCYCGKTLAQELITEDGND